jgi:hypothetical protein
MRLKARSICEGHGYGIPLDIATYLHAPHHQLEAHVVLSSAEVRAGHAERRSGEGWDTPVQGRGLPSHTSRHEHVEAVVALPALHPQVRAAQHLTGALVIQLEAAEEGGISPSYLQR